MTNPDTDSQSPALAPKVKRALRPRDAATLVIFDLSNSEPRILMGRRRMDQVFLPGHYVFPGGRVDRHDRNIPLATDLHPRHAEMLMLGMNGRPSAARATAIAVAAVRETFEETGFVIGELTKTTRPPSEIPDRPWRSFLESGFAPALGDLHYFARAITPPGRPRRYDTRFFAVAREAVSGPFGAGDGELEDTAWLTIAEVKHLKLPSITRLVLEDFVALLERIPGPGVVVQPETMEPGIPFYFHRHGSFQRVLLSRSATAP